ncbi:hypothetical protein [Bacteroides sp. 519]
MCALTWDNIDTETGIINISIIVSVFEM